MANNSTKSAKTKVIHAGFLLADPDIQPKSEQSILFRRETSTTIMSNFTGTDAGIPEDPFTGSHSAGPTSAP